MQLLPSYASTTVYAGAVTEEQVMGVQKTIKAMECTVEDTGIEVEGAGIEVEGAGYEADDVICKDGQYDVYLDKDFKVTKKVKED